MIQKAHIENFLRINGIPPDSPDEEIRTALISARWQDDDVEVALLVLRGQTETEDVHVVAARKLFHSDSRVSPKVLSTLLGINIHSKDENVTAYYSKRVVEKEESHTFAILVSALILAAVAVTAAMYLFGAGFFYVSELPV
ncbi:hypothetical protein GW943_00220 [Candidatus Parcubacteria bacterium]|uniref:Uncharacterized protein n=1 Tax=Candidatus Kaiserbacteria bacterium CG10_big_fil_rev_8_21_14_0_10_47_16 TaxID=1974608 RepID=A0A2H0UD03_9BACT|nr:hypothetical protein [Candidatus Parcubacteria bacterium]PIR84272.1 MAG: hypothetical protein COU16_01595 [Candidatus Kaiserbacteria bacterium CG10_big_fil_rev_8_21_14_0_10_47_16]